jgi:acetyl esterase
MNRDVASPDFMPGYNMTRDERLRLAEVLRQSNLMETILSENQLTELDRVSVSEHSVTTRCGPSRVLEVTPHTALPRGPLFINIHGGGFVRGYHERDTLFCAQLANRLGIKVLDLDYRLAPEHPFPTAVHECFDVVTWAFENAGNLDVDLNRIALGGHSAGANITAAITLMAIDNDSFQVCAQLLDYPMVDGITPSEQKIATGGKFFPLERLEGFMILYSDVPDNRTNRYFSPIVASNLDLARMPPAMINIAFDDPLRMEAWQYAGRLIENGVDVDVRQFHNSRHGFIIAGTDECQRAREGIYNWLAEKLQTVQ